MTVAIYQPGAKVARGQLADDFQLNANTLQDIISAGANTVVNSNDRVIDRTSSTLVENTAEIERIGSEDIVFQSLTPSVCIAPSGAGKPTWVTNGTCVIQGTSNRGAAWGRRNLTFPCNRVGGQVADSVRFAESAAPTSLRQHLITSLLPLLIGKTPSAQTCDMYSEANYGSTKSATINPNCVIDASKFSFMSFSNWGASACFFIGPRHAIYAAHTQSNYAQVTVRRKNGTFQTVNRVSQYSLSGDFALGYFDADVTGIDYVELLPQVFESKVQISSLPTSGLRLPAFSWQFNSGQEGTTPYPITTTHSRHFRIQAFGSMRSYGPPGQDRPFPGSTTQQQFCGWSPDTGNPTYSDWGSLAYGGDSSSGCFFLINGKPVLYSTHFSAGSGPWIPQMQTGNRLADAMNTLAGTSGVYAPVWADLSMFPSYP